MEIVLGVSMTPMTVRMVLVEGERADGVVLEHDIFDITATDGSATSSASDHVIAAILGTQEGAIENGHDLVSTGVTWSDHAEAAVLREALDARGLEDVTLVSELHAAAELAHAVGRAVGYDRTALMSRLQDLVSVPVIAPEEPGLALARGAALASANAPRFDASTVGLAYSQDPGGITALAGDAGAFLDAADTDSYSDDAQAGGKRFALVPSSLTAVFAVGMTALAIAMGVNIHPTFERATGAITVRPSEVAPPPIRNTQPAAPQPAPTAVPEPAPAAPSPAAAATARLMIPPAPPPPRVVIRSVAPAPAAPPPPPPVAPPPVLPVPIIQWPPPWLPPILQPPPYYPPPQQRPPRYPAPWGPHGPGGRGGPRHGDHDDGD